MGWTSFTKEKSAAFLVFSISVSLLCFLSTISSVRGQSRTGGYAIVTANPLATAAALQMLDLGGSAADAAIAAQLVLGAVEPQSSGIGGGAILLYREASKGRIRAFDGLARSPSDYDPQISSASGFRHSGAAVGVPGSLRLMALLHSRYGKLPWEKLFGPAIDAASNGVRVSPYLARSLAAATRSGFVPPPWLLDNSGKAVSEGALIRNEVLAASMRVIAQHGPTAFYSEIGPDIVSAISNSSTPGVMTESDLQNYQAAERVPLCLNYHQIHLCTFPPPSYGGIAVLEILGLLNQLEAWPPDFLNVGFVHTFIEAGRIAEADRSDVVGDPDLGTASVAPLLDREYLEKRAALVDSTQSLRDPVEAGAGNGSLRPTCLSAASPPPSTSQIAIVDRWGAALSMTTTINVNFGSWLTARGFFLNNAMTNFTCANNQPAGNKRSETSMAPVIATDRASRTILVGGSAGGGEIVDYVAQAILELIRGTPPLQALDAGHVSTARSPYSDSAGLVELEEGRAVASLMDRLVSLGHKVKVVPLESGLGFLKWQNGGWVGAADPRRDGNWVGGR